MEEALALNRNNKAQVNPAANNICGARIRRRSNPWSTPPVRRRFVSCLLATEVKMAHNKLSPMNGRHETVKDILWLSLPRKVQSNIAWEMLSGIELPCNRPTHPVATKTRTTHSNWWFPYARTDFVIPTTKMVDVWLGESCLQNYSRHLCSWIPVKRYKKLIDSEGPWYSMSVCQLVHA